MSIRSIAMCIFLYCIHIHFLNAEEVLDTLQLPTITVYKEKPALFQIDSTNVQKQFEQSTGLSIRKFTNGSPSHVSILGAPITGTKLEFHGIELNDPRTNVADLNEVPFWKYQSVKIEVGESSGAQGGTIKIDPINPADFRGWMYEHKFQSNQTQSFNGLFSFGSMTPTGIGFRFERKPKGSYPNKDSHSRINYGGYQRTSFYLNHTITSNNFPTQFELMYSKSKFDLTGLIYRAVESETHSTKEQVRAIIGVVKPIPVRFSYVTDEVAYNRPQWQYSPNGMVPFTPFAERSKRNGLETQLFLQWTIAKNTTWRGQVDWQLDHVRFRDELLKTDVENNSTRNLLTFQNQFTQEFKFGQVKFYPKFSMMILLSEWFPVEKKYNAILPYFNFKWYPNSNLEIVHKIGKAVRLPSLQELFISPTVFSKGNPELLPELSKEIQSEINYKISSIMRFSVLGYSRWIENGIVWKRNSRGQYTTYNSAKTYSMGGIITNELKTAKAHRFNVSASLTDTKNDNSIDINYKKQMPLIPKNQYNIAWFYSPTFNLRPELKLNWNFISKRFALESNTDVQEKIQLSSESIYDVSLKLFPFQSKLESDNSYYIEISCDNILNTRRWWSEGIPNQDRIWAVSMVWNRMGGEQ